MELNFAPFRSNWANIDYAFQQKAHKIVIQMGEQPLNPRRISKTIFKVMAILRRKTDIFPLIDNNNLIYYSQLVSNRSFNGQQLKMHRFQPYTEAGYLKGVGHRVSVAKHCNR